ncbi:MAG: Gfo/Idh/MocA family oxidoreductase [Candidatus Lokiarchaeota archaeon]|nr:Gfo/Idh/MocA family oxidoreductase [Candidatus Lokiarchaeota archaeon]
MLKVGIVGTGVIFDLNVLGYLDEKDVQITCLCDNRIEAAREKIKKFGLGENIQVYTDYKQMIENEEIDMIEFLLPHHLHSEAVIFAASNRIKAISVQKPMALSLSEADEMIAACKKSGSILSIYENFLFAPQIVTAKKLLEEGAIGDLLAIRIKTVMGAKGGWIVPESAQSWRRDPKLIGGHSTKGSPVLLDNGWHAFALGYWMFGNEIEFLKARTDSYGDVDAPAYVFWKFKKAASQSYPQYGILEFCLMPEMVVPSKYYPTDEFIEISGTKGMMWINQCTSRGNQMSGSGIFPSIVLYINGKIEKIEEERQDWKYSFINATKHFINVLKMKVDPVLSGETARYILKFNLAAIESAEVNKEIKL